MYQNCSTDTTELEIVHKVWKDLIVDIVSDLCPRNAEFETKRVDMDTLLDGRKQDNTNRIRLHTICPGRRD